MTSNFIYSKRVFAKLSDCTTISVCNGTNCLYYERDSMSFSLLRKSSLIKNKTRHDAWAQELHGYRQAHYGSMISEDIKNIFAYMHIDNSTKSSPRNEFFTFPGSTERFIRDRGLFAPEDHTGRKYYKKRSLLEEVRASEINTENSIKCTADNASHFMVELNGPLPEGCSYLSIYNDTHILTLTLLSNFYAHGYRRRLEYCTQQQLRVSRPRRAAILGSNSTANTHNRNHPGLLRFNLPGYR